MDGVTATGMVGGGDRGDDMDDGNYGGDDDEEGAAEGISVAPEGLAPAFFCFFCVYGGCALRRGLRSIIL